MKKLILALLLLPALASPALAADNQALRDRATMIQLSVIAANKSMMELCGITGDDAAKYTEKSKELETKLQAALSEDGKKNMQYELDRIAAGVKASWDTTPEDQRKTSCEALKTRLSKE